MIVQIRRARDFGAGGIIECVLISSEIKKEEDFLLVFDRMATMADKALAHYAAVNNHHIDTNPMIGEGLPIDLRVFPATQIVVTMKDGKKLHKVKGGEYQEHGIPFYAEYMKANGINPGEIPDEGQALEGYVMTVEFKNNAPKRVIKLVKGQNA